MNLEQLLDIQKRGCKYLTCSTYGANACPIGYLRCIEIRKLLKHEPGTNDFHSNKLHEVYLMGSKVAKYLLAEEIFKEKN